MSNYFKTSTVLPDGEDVWGSHIRVLVVDITTGTSYSGGFTVAAGNYGLSSISGIELLAADTNGVFITFVATTMPGTVTGGVVHFWIGSSTTELSTTPVTARLRITGE